MKLLSRPIWICVLTVLLAPITACGDRRSDEQRLVDARNNIEQRDYRAAVIDLKNILRGQPDNVEARLALGEAALMVGDIAGAEKELSRAHELGADADRYAALLAQAMLQSGAYSEVLAELDPAALSDPAKADAVRAYRGFAMLELGSTAEANALFDDIAAREAGGEAMRLALIGKARIAGRGGDLEAAESLVRQSLDFVPDSADSTLLLGQLLLRRDQHAQAEEVFDYGRSELSGSAMNQFMLRAGEVEALLGQEKNDLARERATELVKGGMNHPMGRYMLARALLKTNEPESAAEELRKLLSKFPGYTPAQVLLGAVALQLGDFEQAEMTLVPVVSDFPNNDAARRLLAEARMRMNRPDEAADTLRGGTADAQSLNMLARAEFSRGDQGSAIELLEESLRKEPGNVQTQLALIAAYVADGQVERATSAIGSLPEDALSPQRRESMLVVAGIDRNKISESVTEIDDLVSRWPDDQAIMYVAAGLYVAGDLDDKARALYERLHELNPADTGIMTNIARLDSRAGNFDRSRELFEAHLNANPDSIDASIALARIAVIEGDEKRARRYMEQANEIDPDALLPNLMLVNAALAKGDMEMARRYADAALRGNPNAAAAHATVGTIEARSGNPQAAVQNLRKAIELDPANPRYYYAKGVAEVQLGLLEPARVSFGKVLELNADALRARRALMILDAKAGDESSAESHLAELMQRAPGTVETLEAEGDLRAEQGRAVEAAEAYTKAAEVAPSRRLAQRLFELRKKANLPEPLAPLAAWLAKTPDDRVVRLLYAQELQARGDAQAAIEEYETLLKQDETSALAMNNLAWLYLEQGDTAAQGRALELARGAHETAPGNSQIADTYGWVLFKAGQTAQARDVLETALGSQSPGQSPDIAYHLAAVLNDAGDRTGARRLLDEALRSGRPFYSKADAQALLNSL